AFIFLNSSLLFVVLFYVYPLKFLFSLVVSGMIFGNIRTPSGELMITDTQVPQLFLLYGIGFCSVAFVFLLMHRHALGSREKLELTPAEVTMTHEEVVKSASLMVIAAISVTL